VTHRALAENPGVSSRRDGEKPAGGRVERRKARTRAALLAASRELFAYNGFQQTTIAEIAERADIAIGSFYNYFRTKEDLLDALLEEELTRELLLLQARQAQVGDPAEKISVAHRHLVLSARADPNWAWLIVRLEVPYRIAWTVLGRAAEQDLLEGIEGGEFEVADTALALKASGGALFAVIHAELAGELGEGADCEHAEGVLRSFGLDRAAAAEIARRPLPPVPGGARASGG
jgi:AcrR family transcriptional regulator